MISSLVLPWFHRQSATPSKPRITHSAAAAVVDHLGDFCLPLNSRELSPTVRSMVTVAVLEFAERNADCTVGKMITELRTHPYLAVRQFFDYCAAQEGGIGSLQSRDLRDLATRFMLPTMPRSLSWSDHLAVGVAMLVGAVAILGKWMFVTLAQGTAALYVLLALPIARAIAVSPMDSVASVQAAVNEGVKHSANLLAWAQMMQIPEILTLLCLGIGAFRGMREVWRR